MAELDLYGLPVLRLEDARYRHEHDGQVKSRQVGRAIILDNRRGWATLLHIVQRRRRRGWHPAKACIARWRRQNGRWRLFATFWATRMDLHTLAAAARLVASTMQQIERTLCGSSPPTTSSRPSSTETPRT